MEQGQHIALFGASGRTGREILKQALTLKYKVTALVRNKACISLTHPNLTLIEGTPERMEDVEKTIANTTCVMVALNISRRSDFPWAEVITPEYLLRNAMKNIVLAMETIRVTRIITISAWGVYDSYQDIDPVLKFLINYSKIGITYRGHEEQEQVLRNSDLNWTAVRPVNLKNNSQFKQVIERHNNRNKLKMTLGRNDLAKYMLDILNKPQYFKQAPAISNG